jgi:hypothetical protein
MIDDTFHGKSEKAITIISRVLESAALRAPRSERRSIFWSGERSAALKMKLRAGAGAPLYIVRERSKRAPLFYRSLETKIF